MDLTMWSELNGPGDTLDSLSLWNRACRTYFIWLSALGLSSSIEMRSGLSNSFPWNSIKSYTFAGPLLYTPFQKCRQSHLSKQARFSFWHPKWKTVLGFFSSHHQKPDFNSKCNGQCTVIIFRAQHCLLVIAIKMSKDACTLIHLRFHHVSASF